MILEYIDNAMSKAQYNMLEDGTFFGKIPKCPGVIAFGKTLFNCQKELEFALEGWIIVKLRHGDKLPTFGKINLNTGSYSTKKVKLDESLASL